MKVWIKAFRLRTLPLSFSSIIVGSFLNYDGDNFSWPIFSLAILTTLFLQILSNLANDLGDFQKGTDNQDRVGPERALQSGSISVKSMKIAVVIFSLLSLICGITLLLQSFSLDELKFILFFLALGIVSILAAIKYTIGRSAYGYRSLGDFFVFIFFGLIGVLGSNFLQTQSISLSSILPATSVGFLAMAVLNMNNLRDIVNDKAMGKNTLAVNLGVRKTKYYQIILICSSFLLWITYGVLSFDNLWQLLFLIGLLPVLTNISVVLNYRKAEELNNELKKISLSSFFCSVLFLVSSIFM